MRHCDLHFIKVHNGMTPGIYDAIADESHSVGLPFDGHVPDAGPIAAAEAGQRTLEYGQGMLLCSPETWEHIRTDPEAHNDASFCASPHAGSMLGH
jgi:hypothetical protein